MLDATNGFHDSANAVATAIYPNAICPTPAATSSGLTNVVAGSPGLSDLICVFGVLLFRFGVQIPTPGRRLP